MLKSSEQEIRDIARGYAQNSLGIADMHAAALVALHLTRDHGMSWPEVKQTMGWEESDLGSTIHGAVLNRYETYGDYLKGGGKRMDAVKSGASVGYQGGN